MIKTLTNPQFKSLQAMIKYAKACSGLCNTDLWETMDRNIKQAEEALEVVKQMQKSVKEINKSKKIMGDLTSLSC